jgi:hypothetical protein
MQDSAGHCSPVTVATVVGIGIVVTVVETTVVVSAGSVVRTVLVEVRVFVFLAVTVFVSSRHRGICGGTPNRKAQHDVA